MELLANTLLFFSAAVLVWANFPSWLSGKIRRRARAAKLLRSIGCVVVDIPQIDWSNLRAEKAIEYRVDTDAVDAVLDWLGRRRSSADANVVGLKAMRYQFGFGNVRQEVMTKISLLKAQKDSDDRWQLIEEEAASLGSLEETLVANNRTIKTGVSLGLLLAGFLIQATTGILRFFY